MRSGGSKSRGSPSGAGPRCTTTSAASAPLGGEARRPTRGATAPLRLRLRPDRDPADVPADRAAGIHLVRPPDGGLRVDAAALEAADARENREAGRALGFLHTEKDAGRPQKSRRGRRLPRAPDVVRDRGDQLRLRRERRLVAELLPQLHDEPSSVQVALVVEEERLDAPFAAAVVRIRSDRDRGSVAVRLAGVDPERRNEETGGDVDVRGRKAEPGAAMVAVHDGPLHFGRPADELRRGPDVAAREQHADVARRHVVDERHAAGVEAQPFQQVEVSRAAAAEAEAVAGGDHLGARRAEDRPRELLRRQVGERCVEPQDEHVLDPLRLQQLEPALERREQRHLGAEERARMRVEGHDRGTKAGRDRRLEHAHVAAVHAVERADRDRAPCRRELAGTGGDVHSRPSTSSSLSSSNASGAWASSIANGPTAVRRSVRQWPPSAWAIERTYVPLLTWRSIVTELS